MKIWLVLPTNFATLPVLQETGSFSLYIYANQYSYDLLRVTRKPTFLLYPPEYFKQYDCFVTHSSSFALSPLISFPYSLSVCFTISSCFNMKCHLEDTASPRVITTKKIEERTARTQAAFAFWEMIDPEKYKNKCNAADLISLLQRHWWRKDISVANFGAFLFQNATTTTTITYHY